MTTPHIQFPLRLDEQGRLRVVEQDTIDDVRQCVDVLRRTPLDVRTLAPDVGVPDPTFTGGVDALALTARLEDEDTGEPRAAVTVDAQPVEGTGRQRVAINVALADFAGDIDPDAPEEL